MCLCKIKNVCSFAKLISKFQFFSQSFNCPVKFFVKRFYFVSQKLWNIRDCFGSFLSFTSSLNAVLENNCIQECCDGVWTDKILLMVIFDNVMLRKIWLSIKLWIGRFGFPNFKFIVSQQYSYLEST